MIVKVRKLKTKIYIKNKIDRYIKLSRLIGKCLNFNLLPRVFVKHRITSIHIFTVTPCIHEFIIIHKYIKN